MWIKNINQEATQNNIQILRFKRVPFGIKTSPFLLNATLQHYLMKSNYKIAEKLLNGVYIDNFVIGYNNTEEAIKSYDEINKIFSKCSMNLQEFKSNKKEFNDIVLKEKLLKLTEINLLGIKWNCEEDTIYINSVLCETVITKRSITKELGKVFDPLGFFCPILIKGKVILKKLWIYKTSWKRNCRKV